MEPILGHETTSPAAIESSPAATAPTQPLDYASRSGFPPDLPNSHATVSLICSALLLSLLVTMAFVWNSLNAVTGPILVIITPVIAILALIFGIIGVRNTRDGRTRGKAVAIAAICVGALGLLSLASIFFLSPSLNPPHETSPRVRCAANLKQIGLALQLYANENKGQYPPGLEDLILTQDITSEVFICPDTTDTRATGTTLQQQASSLMAGGHCSYIYLAKGMTASAPANTILAYESTTHHTGGMNVLFGDGHVEFINAYTAQQIINQLQSGQNPPPAYH